MDSRLHIIREATRMFVEEGLKNVRMDDIARRLGISKRTIYELFANKEELINECADQYFIESENHFLQNVTDNENIIQQIIFILRQSGQFMDQNPSLIQSLQKFYPHIYRQTVIKHYEKGVEMMYTGMRKGIEQGLLLENFDVDLAVSIFTHQMYGLSGFLTEGKFSQYRRREVVNFIILFFFRGIATEKGREIIDRYMNDIELPGKFHSDRLQQTTDKSELNKQRQESETI